MSNTPILSTRPSSSSPEGRTSHPVEDDNFLTALAAHERRVLELKEELQKAEIDLGNLKKQWAAHEATKKRNEFRHIEQLRPPRTTSQASIVGPEDLRRVVKGSHRKEDTSSNTRAAPRKIFSGSRHTRALSLLSSRSSSSLAVARVGYYQTSTGEEAPSMVVPSKTIEESRSQGADQELHPTSDKEAILETGKQIVGDFRHGLWTFFEDLKQVTVGEEASRFVARDFPHPSGPERQKAPSKGQASTVGKQAMRMKLKKIVEDKRHQTQSSHTSGQTLDDKVPLCDVENSGSSDSDDGWDNWETAGPESANIYHNYDQEVLEPMVSPLTEASSRRSSLSSPDKTSQP